MTDIAKPIGMLPPSDVNWAREFFDRNEQLQANNEIQQAAGAVINSTAYDPDQLKYSEFMRFMKNVSDGEIKIENGQVTAADFFKSEGVKAADDWVQDFNDGKDGERNTQ